MKTSIDNSGIDTTTFDLEGTHYDIGVAIGKASAPFTLPAWWPEPPPLAFAEACAREISVLHPMLLDDIHGHADGQAQSYNDLLRIICRQRLGGRGFAAVSIPEHGGCTSMAWRAPNGHILIGRNYDFHEVQRIRQRIRLRPEGSRPTVGMRGSVPAGRYDGVNDAGLFVSLHVVLSDQPRTTRPGIPFHLIPRMLLETCGNLREALDLITMMPHLHSFNYLLADPGGFAVVECHAERMRILYPEGDVLACGNFFRHPDMAPFQNRRQQVVSRQRVDYLESGTWQAGDMAGDQSGNQSGDSWATLQATMRDHEAHVCGHTGGHTTLWSVITDLTDRRVAYSIGAPCCADYSDVLWPR